MGREDGLKRAAIVAQPGRDVYPSGIIGNPGKRRAGK
jgi:hypothetical protein